MNTLVSDLKKVIIKYWLLIKLKWLGFVTEVKILIGIKSKAKNKVEENG